MRADGIGSYRDVVWSVRKEATTNLCFALWKRERERGEEKGNSVDRTLLDTDTDTDTDNDNDELTD
jgi:hypothetical protein